MEEFTLQAQQQGVEVATNHSLLGLILLKSEISHPQKGKFHHLVEGLHNIPDQQTLQLVVGE
jgi:hypothetical protein